MKWSFAAQFFGSLVLTSLAAVTLSGSAPAALRYNASGISCTTDSGASYDVNVVQGFSSQFVYCPVPTGAGLVNLTAAPQLDEVRIAMYQSGTAAVLTSLYLHDYNSTSFCGCDAQTGSHSGFFSRTHDLSCGSCSYDSTFSANVAVFNFSGSHTQVKNIRAFD